MTEPKPARDEMTPAQVKRATDALADRELWVAVRAALLRLVDVVEVRLGMPVLQRNVTLRKQNR